MLVRSLLDGRTALTAGRLVSGDVSSVTCQAPGSASTGCASAPNSTVRLTAKRLKGTAPARAGLIASTVIAVPSFGHGGLASGLVVAPMSSRGDGRSRM